MLPIVVYLPQLLEGTEIEYTSLLFNCKYDEIPTTPTTTPPTTTSSSTTTPTKSTEPPITDSSEPRKDLPKTIGTPSGGEGPKSFPSTNELIRNYCFLGLLLMSVGLIGLNKNKGEKNYENKRKWVALLTTLLCMIPLLAGVLGGGESAFAADSANVTIHKKKWTSFRMQALKILG